MYKLNFIIKLLLISYITSCNSPKTNRGAKNNNGDDKPSPTIELEKLNNNDGAHVFLVKVSLPENLDVNNYYIACDNDDFTIYLGDNDSKRISLREPGYHLTEYGNIGATKEVKGGFNVYSFNMMYLINDSLNNQNVEITLILIDDKSEQKIIKKFKINIKDHNPDSENDEGATNGVYDDTAKNNEYTSKKIYSPKDENVLNSPSKSPSSKLYHEQFEKRYNSLMANSSKITVDNKQVRNSATILDLIDSMRKLIVELEGDIKLKEKQNISHTQKGILSFADMIIKLNSEIKRLEELNVNTRTSFA